MITQSAIGISPFSAVSHSPCSEGAYNLIVYCMKFGISFIQVWHCGSNKAIVCAVRRRSSLYHYYMSKDAYEAVKQQWIPPLVAHYPIYYAEMVPKILYFAWNLRLHFGRTDLMATRRGWYMLLEASLIILIHLRKAMKYSSSNGCPSLHHTITISVLEYCQNRIHCMQFGISFW